MNNVLLYILQVLVYIHLFHFLYKRYLYELALLVWSRIYLVVSGVAALFLPLVQVHFWPLGNQQAEFWAFVPGNTDMILSLHRVALPEISPDVVAILGMPQKIYLAGVLVFSLRLLWSVWRVWRRPESKSGFAWSFFDKVYLSAEVLALPDGERAQVVCHEETHGRELHSLDNLLYEAITVVLWFNPFMPRLKANLVELHEYLADRSVVERYDKVAYSRLILRLASEQRVGVTSDFASQLIGKRLYMLHKTPKVDFRTLRFLLAMPLALMLVLLFSVGKSKLTQDVKGADFNTSVYDFPLTGRFEILKPFIGHTEIRNGFYTLVVSHKSVALMPLEPQRLVCLAQTKIEGIWVSEQGLRHRIALRLPNKLLVVISGIEVPNLKVGTVLKRGEALAEINPHTQMNVVELELWEGNVPKDPMVLFK